MTRRCQDLTRASAFGKPVSSSNLDLGSGTLREIEGDPTKAEFRDTSQLPHVSTVPDCSSKAHQVVRGAFDHGSKSIACRSP